MFTDTSAPVGLGVGLRVSDRVRISERQCYFSCDFLVIVIVKVIIFQVFQLQF